MEILRVYQVLALLRSLQPVVVVVVDIIPPRLLVDLVVVDQMLLINSVVPESPDKVIRVVVLYTVVVAVLVELVLVKHPIPRQLRVVRAKYGHIPATTTLAADLLEWADHLCRVAVADLAKLVLQQVLQELAVVVAVFVLQATLEPREVLV